MTTDGLLAILLNVLLPAITAILGGVLAVRSLGKLKPVEKWLWVSGFVFCGLLGVVIGVVQQIRFSTQQRIAEAEAANSRLQASNEVKYTQGELDAIKGLLQVFAQNTDPAKQALLVRSLAGSIKLPAPQPTPPATTPGPTNAQIKNNALDLARRLREFQQREDAHWVTERQVHKDNQTAIPQTFFTGQLIRFAPLRLEAQQMRTALLNRLPPQPDNSTVRMALDEDALAGPEPLFEVANYFEILASQLDTK